MSRYGRIYGCQLKNGFGFVEFHNPRDAAKAIKDEDGTEFCGQRITVEWAKGEKDDFRSRPQRFSGPPRRGAPGVGRRGSPPPYRARGPPSFESRRPRSY